MADADDMPNVAQAELEKLVGHDTGSIAEAKQTVVCEDSVQAHRPRMQQAFMAKVAERAMSMNDLDFFANENLAEMWK